MPSARSHHRPLLWVVAVLLALGGIAEHQSILDADQTVSSVQSVNAALQSQSTPPPSQPILSVPAGLRAKKIIIIPITREIDRITTMSTLRRIKIAENAGADAIVFELDCPGGEVGAVLDITSAIKTTTVPMTIGWVRPMAYSGAAIVALSCDHIITADTAAMGDAFPITLGFEGVKAVPDELRVKVFPPLIAEVTDSARRAGYDEYLTQAIVMNGIELWLVEHTETGRHISVDADEYEILFGKEPTRGKPMIQTGSRALRTATPTKTPQSTPTTAAGADGERANTKLNRTQSTPINTPDDEYTFKPAFAGHDDVVKAINEKSLLREKSHRPTITQADRGKWTHIEYVTDGSAPIVMGPDEMVELGYAMDIISTDTELEQHFGAQEVHRLDPEWTESLAGFLSILAHPLIRGVLIAIFLMGLMIELSAPGLGIPGLIAVGALLATLLPAVLVGIASWWELGAIGAGIVLIAIELFVIPGFGVPGILGIILMFGGLVATFVGPGTGGGLLPSESGQQTDLLYGVTAVLLSVSGAGVGFYFLTRNAERFPMFQKLTLEATVKTPIDHENSIDPLFEAMRPPAPPTPDVGEVGTVLLPLRPFGRAEFDGRVIEVVAAAESADPGDRVRVIAVRDQRIEVERVDRETT